MVLLNPWWMAVPAAALGFVLLWLLWQMAQRWSLPFTALPWLRPAPRRPRMFRAKPPLWLLLVAGSVVVSAFGTLHFAVVPSGQPQRHGQILFAIRYLHGRPYGYIRTDDWTKPPQMSIDGLGKAIKLSPSQLIRGQVFPLAAGLRASHVALRSGGKIIWQTSIPPHTFHSILYVTVGHNLSRAMIRALKAIPWVRIKNGGRRVALFVGHHWRYHFTGSQLIVATSEAQRPVEAAAPIAISGGYPVLRFIQFQHVRVYRLANLHPKAGWQVLAQVNGRPWILQRQRMMGYDWLVASSLTNRSTNWPKFASFVIFLTNALDLAGHLPPASSSWMVRDTITPKATDTISPVNMGWILGLLTAALLVGAIGRLRSQQA